MKFDTEYIEQLAKVITDNGLSEISLEDGEQAITLRKEAYMVSGVAPVAAPVAAVQSSPAAEAKKETAPQSV